MHDQSPKNPFNQLGSHFERLNYYFGKMLTVRDFKAEQSYLNEKRWLLNRLGLGWGVLCGLKIVPCGGGKIAIQPGVALDSYGNEIWVAEQQVVDLAEAEIEDAGAEDLQSPPEPDCFYIYLKYVECQVEAAPVPVEDCGELKTDCAYGRIREQFKIIVSRQKPRIRRHFESALKDMRDCEYDCVRYLENPCPVIIESCPEREKCVGVPLGRVCFTEEQTITEKEIDNCAFRQIAFSNERLWELLRCLRNQLWKAHAARYDRKQYVPLLTQTIKGLKFREGKIFTHTENVGINPCRMTTDGDHIWITDRESERLVRICRKDNSVVTDPPVQLEMKNWGIAYDGRRMWVAHHESADPASGMGGKVTGVNVCNLADRRSISELKDYPREIVFDGRHLWIAHHKTTEENRATVYYLSLTLINPRHRSVVGTYEAPLPADANSTVKGMAFDGQAVWVIYETGEGNGLRRAWLEDGEIQVGDPLDCGTDKPEDIAFDGTHIWVSGKNGAFKIDIYGEDDPESPFRKRDHSALAFDGKYMWAAEYKENRFNRADTLVPDVEAGGEEIAVAGADYQVSRMCFDGEFIWAAASIEISSQPAQSQQPPASQRKGLVHRLLA